MKVTWSERAERDAEEIAQFIGRDSPAAAIDWLEKTFEAVEDLPEFPMLGRIVPEFGIETIRELVRGRYRIVYEVGEGEVTILTVFDGARLLP